MTTSHLHLPFIKTVQKQAKEKANTFLVATNKIDVKGEQPTFRYVTEMFFTITIALVIVTQHFLLPIIQGNPNIFRSKNSQFF